MDQDQQIQIKREIEDTNDLFESSDEDVRQLNQVEFQDYFDVQEEVVVQECPEQEVITQSWDLNHSNNIDK